MTPGQEEILTYWVTDDPDDPAGDSNADGPYFDAVEARGVAELAKKAVVIVIHKLSETMPLLGGDYRPRPQLDFEVVGGGTPVFAEKSSAVGGSPGYRLPTFDSETGGAEWECRSHVAPTGERPPSTTAHRLNVGDGYLFEVRHQRWYDEGTALYEIDVASEGKARADELHGEDPARWVESEDASITLHFERKV